MIITNLSYKFKNKTNKIVNILSKSMKRLGPSKNTIKANAKKTIKTTLEQNSNSKTSSHLIRIRSTPAFKHNDTKNSTTYDIKVFRNTNSAKSFDLKIFEHNAFNVSSFTQNYNDIDNLNIDETKLDDYLKDIDKLFQKNIDISERYKVPQNKLETSSQAKSYIENVFTKLKQEQFDFVENYDNTAEDSSHLEKIQYTLKTLGDINTQYEEKGGYSFSIQWSHAEKIFTPGPLDVIKTNTTSIHDFSYNKKGIKAVLILTDKKTDIISQCDYRHVINFLFQAGCFSFEEIMGFLTKTTFGCLENKNGEILLQGIDSLLTESSKDEPSQTKPTKTFTETPNMYITINLNKYMIKDPSLGIDHVTTQLKDKNFDREKIEIVLKNITEHYEFIKTHFADDSFVYANHIQVWNEYLLHKEFLKKSNSKELADLEKIENIIIPLGREMSEIITKNRAKLKDRTYDF